MKTVGVTLLGGLGNQMFQYATARTLADRRRADVALNVSSFVGYKLRNFELHGLQVRAKILSPDVPAPVGPDAHSPGRKERLRQLLGIGSLLVWRERSFRFDPQLLKQRAPLHLEGYFQSDKYFLDNADAIRRDFRVRGEPDAANRSFLERIAQTTSVSLHVRRGDYVNDPTTAAYHGSCSPAYYREAVERIAQRCGPLTLFVFSDDLAWVAANMRFDQPTVYVDCNSADKGIWDMHLMKHCRHHVIANSSFSWWGAWLNPSPDKIVVAPRNWFTDATTDTSDLIPSSWIRG